jgi:hypothetical protein
MPIKVWLYLGALLVLVLGYWGWESHVKALGAAQVEARDARALADQRLSQIATLKHEAQVNEDAKTALQAENNRLAALAAKPIGPVRLCLPASHSSTGTAPATVAGGTEPPSPTGRGVSGVPTGVAEQPDLGPALQQLALRADQLSAQVRALLAREQGLAQ